MSQRFLEVRSLETDEVVKRIDVTGKSERHVERVESGLLTNMDCDRFYVDDTVLDLPEEPTDAR